VCEEKGVRYHHTASGFLSIALLRNRNTTCNGLGRHGRLIRRLGKKEAPPFNIFTLNGGAGGMMK
jgi:hypothetical protein